MKKGFLFLLILVFAFLIPLISIKYYFQEDFKNNVKNKVFEECFNYYSNQGVGIANGVTSFFSGATGDTIRVCVNKADSVLDKE